MARGSWGTYRARPIMDRGRLDGSIVGGRLSGGFDQAGLRIEVEGSRESDLGLAFRGELEAAIAADLRRLEQAYHRAATRVMEAGKGRLRADIVAGGFHKAVSLSKTWQGKVFPSRPESLDVAVWFKTKASLIIDVFESGTVIRASDGHYLAIPLPPAKAIIRRLRRAKMRGPREGGAGRDQWGRYTKDESYVEQVASALGVDLRPIIDRQTRTGVLVADNGLRLTRSGRESKRQEGRATAIFALAPLATLRPRIKGRKILAEIERSFGPDFVHALQGELHPSNREG